MPISGLEVAAPIIALLVSSGALTFFFKYGIRLALVEKVAAKAATDSEQHGKDIASTRTEISLLTQMVAQINARLSKLDQIDKVVATVDLMQKAQEEKFKELVPRNEHEARWAAFDHGLANVANQVAALRDHIVK